MYVKVPPVAVTVGLALLIVTVGCVPLIKPVLLKFPLVAVVVQTFVPVVDAVVVKVIVKNKDYAHLQPLLTTHLHLYCPWQSLLLYFEQPQFELDEGETPPLPPKHPTNANNTDEIRSFFI